MASILVVYGGSEGQTEKVAERIGDRLSSRGHTYPTPYSDSGAIEADR